MKRVVVLVAGILLNVPSLALAQAPSFGLRGGLNMAGFSGRRIVDSDYRNGVTFGAYIAIPISTMVALQPELSFTQQGARSAAYDYSDMPADGDAPPIGVYLTEKTSHDYVSLPLLVKLSPSPAGDRVRPIFFGGPYVGFLLGAKKVYDTDYSEYLSSTDFGIRIGGGLELGRVTLDVAYNLGLATIAEDYDASFGNVPGDIKNRALTVGVGFRLF